MSLRKVLSATAATINVTMVKTIWKPKYMPIQPMLFAMVGKRLAGGADWLSVDGCGGGHPTDGRGGG